VLRYNGRVVDAPYSSTCGGSTAEAAEVWRDPGAPYLKRVSDRVGQSTRYYCDIAPRYRWTAQFTGDALTATLARYLKNYASVPASGPGRARALEITERTPSERVAALRVTTERGTYVLRRNDIRFVLRTPSGEILNSTYFSVVARHDPDGFISALTLSGRGYGHGIGMCQWGAIGRSRAGQSFRSILATYYPGTTVGPVE
jgi:stage II sporulation protein D